MFAGGLIAAVLSISGAGIALLTPPGAPPEPADISDAPTRVVDVAGVVEPSTSDGQLYPFSVVARGVHALHGLKEAMERDAVVADHYGAITVNSFRLERVATPRLVYVSYRKGDDIYWTRNRVPLYAGENVLTDGTTSIRARCGNRVSETPMEPTLGDEPTAAEFDRAIDPGAPSGDRNEQASANQVFSQAGALQEWAIALELLKTPAALPPVIPSLTPSFPHGFVPAIGRAPDLQPVPVPQPASVTLLLLGLGSIGIWRWLRRQ